MKLLEGKDWSLVKTQDLESAGEYFEKSLSLFGFTPSPFNLGIYQTVDNSSQEIILRATQYVGVVPGVKRAQDSETADKSKERPLIKISSRFHISPTEMIEAVLSGDDYYENPDMLKTRSYSEAEWRDLAKHKKNGKNQNEKILFGMINGIGTIDLFANSEGEQGASDTDLGIADAYGVFEIIDFVNKAKEVCKKNLKRQSQRREENLNCKVKGKILIQKQLKYNTSKGQNQRGYCSYNKMTEDIRENQIIKYALHLCQKKHGIGDALAEDIRYCMNALSGVPLRKCSTADFVGLKNNGAFRQYKDALRAAKKVIGRYSLSYSDQKNEGKTETKVQLSNGKVLPYFIDMNLLFEYFCRAIFKKAIAKYNADEENKIRFELESTKKAERKLFAQENKNSIEKFFMKTYIPDIVLRYSQEGKESKVAAVFDAKYSDVEQQQEAKRARTHQILFYMKALGCDYGGLISPYTGEENEIPVFGRIDTVQNVQMFYIPLAKQEQSAFEYYVEITKKYLAEIAHAIAERNERIKQQKENEQRQIQQDICEEICRFIDNTMNSTENYKDYFRRNKKGKELLGKLKEKIKTLGSSEFQSNVESAAGVNGTEDKDERDS